jgi:hypothetical protein
MSIFRSNDPTTWGEIDQIVIDERAPAPSIKGVATNIAGYVARFQRGPESLVEVGTTQELEEIFGKSSASGNENLKNKRFGRMRIRRVVDSGAAQASIDLDDSSSAVALTLKAKDKGVYGNNIAVKVEAGSIASTVKITVSDLNSDAVLPNEVFDNVNVTGMSQDALSSLFSASKLIVPVAVSPLPTGNLAVATQANMTGGADGSAVDSSYEAAIADFEQEKSCNFLFADKASATINGYLEAHAAATKDKMVIVAGSENDSVATAVSDVANYRDQDGRIIYAYPWIETSIGGALKMQSPASWMASVMSQTSPHIDPAYVKNSQFLTGITKLKRTISRASYIQLKDAGIAAFEYDPDIGHKIKSGVVTQIQDSSKIMILRRRMADYLTTSVGYYLKNFQNAVNNRDNRLACGAAIQQFVQLREQEGILPKDDEVQGGLAKLVDVESLNTDASIAQGYFKILWKQRIYSSMRFIVLTAEIGESVVVTEA